MHVKRGRNDKIFFVLFELNIFTNIFSLILIVLFMYLVCIISSAYEY